LGFLITGIIIGPYGLSLIEAVEQVEIISEIGVILLLFVIGMEISIKQLMSMRKTVFIGGFLQVGLTVAVTSFIYKALDYSWNEAVFVGFLFSLSSTAIVLKILQDRNEISAPHGRNALGILIFQDIIVVPMMLVTPILAGESTNIRVAVLDLVLKSGLVILVTYLSARYVVPKLMYLVEKTKSKELFLITTITICFAVAFLTSEAGLSLALGAFLAGLIISESEYSHHATGIILPFRELFSSFFFISIGMLLDLSFFFENVVLVLFLALVVFLLKGSIAAVATAFLKFPPRTLILTGLTLFQIGEFAFILSKEGINYGLLSAETNQYFLSVSIVTMLFTPFVIIYSEKISAFMAKSRFNKKWEAKSEIEKEELENHLVIIGFGINGTNLAKAAKYSKIPYVILELNADTVKKEASKGEPIIFGDAVQEHILESVQIHKARVVVVAISDPQATKVIITNIRNISQLVYVVVRTRYVKDIDTLIALGADEVIPEEFETSIEIFSRVLQNYLIPMDELENLVHSIRSDNYKIFQQSPKVNSSPTTMRISDFQITCVRLLAEGGSVVGKTIAEANVRKKFGVNILAISRKDKMLQALSPEEKLLQNDLVFVTGVKEQIDHFYRASS
jgi:CPA2 family monovalent cation:H+ antiporter-2